VQYNTCFWALVKSGKSTTEAHAELRVSAQAHDGRQQAVLTLRIACCVGCSCPLAPPCAHAGSQPEPLLLSGLPNPDPSIYCLPACPPAPDPGLSPPHQAASPPMASLAGSSTLVLHAPPLLQGTMSDYKNEMLFSQFGINYSTLPERFRKVSVPCRPVTQSRCIGAVIGIQRWSKSRGGSVVVKW